MTTYETIETEQRGRVGIITLNRPKALNALNDQLMSEVVDAVTAWDADQGVGAIVITGSERAFAAGADITQMSGLSYQEAYLGNLFAAGGHSQRRARRSSRRSPATPSAAAASWR